MQEIYLDYNASSPIDPAVAAAMRPYLEEAYGNPSSAHWAGRPAREVVERGRAEVAALLGAMPEEIVFTSGGTEANNLAIQGLFFARTRNGSGTGVPHLITSAVEHPAVLEPMRFLESLGAELSIVPVDGDGRVDPAAVEASLRPGTLLVSIMHANNEVGTLQPIAEIGALCRARGVPFHTDAAQSAGKIETRVDLLQVDLLSLAGHKLYAPKGVGALYIRKGIRPAPLLRGAGHERGFRSGTESALLLAGLGRACALAREHLGDPGLRELRDFFETELRRRLGDRISINGAGAERLPNTSSVNFIGRVGRDLLAGLDGVAASTGAACHSDRVELSAVLQAMRVPPRVGMGAVRFSLGRPTRRAEIEAVLDRIEAAVTD